MCLCVYVCKVMVYTTLSFSVWHCVFIKEDALTHQFPSLIFTLLLGSSSQKEKNIKCTFHSLNFKGMNESEAQE